MQVNILDSAAGAEALSRLWEFSGPTLTLRALLRERVRREVENFNAERPATYHGLVAPTGTERLLNGYRVTRFSPQDWEEHYRRAVDAFEKRGFLVIAGGRQVESLDEEIDLGVARQIEFYRLVPLIGG